MKRFFVSLLLALSLCGACAIPAVPAFAATNPFKDPCALNRSKTSGSAVCGSSSGDPATGSNGVIHKATNIVALLGGVAAVIVIAVAGLGYISSGGDAEKVAKSKRAIIMAVVGLAVIIFGRIIINFILSKV